ncbi:bark storage protein A isoform X1 [Actinidia eriantha]|uniref:bark storage protein A isoform X1 n=1 Tax=Actinidia eriantha TaxID=165200 RepID=UPI0025904842|nr:bark storage protein A isoform X1 [Actinidia eriantha]
MDSHMRFMLLGCLVLVLGFMGRGDGAISHNVMKEIMGINKEGPYLGIVVPNSFEISPLLQSTSFVEDQKLPYLDFSGKRFRLGLIGKQKVIIVMTGLSMLNAGITTQLLLALFRVKGVVHFGIAGNANPNLQIGDVTIPHYWAHTGLWNWQRYGDGPENELALESNGDYTREIGYLEFSDYNNDTKNENAEDYNLLNRVWYQPEEIFPVNGTPEVRQHAFWVPVDKHYFSLAKKLEGIKLEGCVNSTCLPRTPIVTRVERGISANVFVDNGAYREFLYSKFNATAIDMETAAVSLVCLQQRKPFIAIRALSDLAGGGSSVSNEAAIFTSVAAQNAFDVAIQFINLLS